MSLSNDFLSLLFPRLCHVCNRRLNSLEKYICQNCIDELPRTMFHRHPFNEIEQRLAGKVRFEKATALLFYDRLSRYAKIIHDFKYRGFSGMARWAGQYMAYELQQSGFFDEIDFIVPIPLHWTKQIQRGYNQSLLIALGLSDVLKIPVADILIASKRRQTQTKREIHDRRFNIKEGFRLKRGSDIAGKHFLIVDDVCTTGSTIEAAIHAFDIYATQNSDADTVHDFKISVLTLAAPHI